MAEFFQKLFKDIEGQCKNIDDFNKEILKQLGDLNDDALKQLGKTNDEVLTNLAHIISEIQNPINGKPVIGKGGFNPFAE